MFRVAYVEDRVRQRHRLAEHGYREALRRDPAHVQALMNLASLRLVLRCHVTEAAVRAAGPTRHAFLHK